MNNIKLMLLGLMIILVPIVISLHFLTESPFDLVAIAGCLFVVIGFFSEK
jgi:hypothetical membrane protein